MLLASLFSIMLGGRLVQLESSVARIFVDAALVFASAPDRSSVRTSRAIFRFCRSTFMRIDSRHRRADRQAHRITQRLTHSSSLLLDRAAVAAEALHADRGDLAARQLRQHALLKAAEVRVEAVQWKLTRVERIVERKHPQMDIGILVTGEAHVADLSLLLCAIERFDDAARLRSDVPDRCRRRIREPATGRDNPCAAVAATARAAASPPSRRARACTPSSSGRPRRGDLQSRDPFAFRFRRRGIPTRCPGS